MSGSGIVARAAIQMLPGAAVRILLQLMDSVEKENPSLNGAGKKAIVMKQFERLYDANEDDISDIIDLLCLVSKGYGSINAHVRAAGRRCCPK